MRLPLNIAILLISTLSACAQNNESSILKKGDQMPSFSYINISGEELQIKDLSEKNILLFFFATWCAPCLKELAYVEANVYPEIKKYKNLEVLVFGREHSMEEVNKFVKTNNYKMTYLADPKREIYSLFAKSYIPRCYFINKEGEVIYESVGFEKEKVKKLQVLIENTCK